MSKNANNPTELTDGDLNDVEGGMLLPAVQTVRDAGPGVAHSSDGMGNFEIQDHMASFNSMESTASSLQKKTDDTANAVIGKVS